MNLRRTLGVIIGAWEAAEKELREEVAVNAPGLEEEAIRDRFHASFAKILKEASSDLKIERAFLEDLRLEAPGATENELARVSRGLIAEVTLHSREAERFTGGDLGLVIVRPRVTRQYEGNLRILAGYRRGLLCQAKLKRPRGSWGKLTPNQTRVLSQRLGYLSLLLYQYRDVAGRELEEFKWQLCQSSKLNEIGKWLRTGGFPSVLRSREVLTQLGCDQVGTDDREILDNVICPKAARYLVVRIDWPDGGRPEVTVHVVSRHEAKEKVMVRIRA